MQNAVNEVISMADKYRLVNDEAQINRNTLVSLKKDAMENADNELHMYDKYPLASPIAKIATSLHVEKYVSPTMGNLNVYFFPSKSDYSSRKKSKTVSNEVTDDEQNSKGEIKIKKVNADLVINCEFKE